MTTLLLGVGERLLGAPLSVAAPEVLHLLVAHPQVRSAELVLDGAVAARSGKPGGTGVVAFPLAGAGELRVAYDGELDTEPFAVVAQLLALAARTEAAIAEERRGLADDLHDGLVQTLVAARLLPGDDVLRTAVAEARELMRSLRERPAAATFAARLARVSGGELTTDSGDHVVTIRGKVPAPWVDRVRLLGGYVSIEDGRCVVRIPGAAA